MRDRKANRYGAGNSAADLFSRLPFSEIQKIGREVTRLVPLFGLTYTNEEGRTTPITVTLRPRLIDIQKRNALWRILQILDRAFLKIASLYRADPSVPALFPFEPRELDWMSILKEPGYRAGRIISRWDANTAFGERDWKEGFSFFEINGVGIGGIWYGPACAEILLKAVAPRLRKLDPKFRPVPNHDMRLLLLHALLHQRKKIGRTRGAIALVMEKASGSNYIEFERLARLYQRMGYATLVTEPTDFKLRHDEIFARGKKIDILYRDTTLSELCLLEERGNDLSALRAGFRRGQVVSSLEGEFDHKSAFEVFTHPRYLNYFTAAERKIFKDYLLWTRLLREGKTPDANGRVVDLIPFCMKHQARLVLKPNRLFGGKGVVFGSEVKKSSWEKKIAAALGKPGQWVIQELGVLRKKRFFRPGDKTLTEKDLYVVSGFFATERGLGIVGRMSERTVVNVARRGGLTPILLNK